MASQAAQVIDFAAYRQRQQGRQPVAFQPPMVWVAFWTYVPVMVFSGH